MAGGYAWQGVCMVGGMHGRGMHGKGACMARGHAWWGSCMAGETVTAAGSTHPTGMHSCPLCGCQGQLIVIKSSE